MLKSMHTPHIWYIQMQVFMYLYTDTRLHVVNATLFHTLSPELYISLLYKYGAADSLNGIFFPKIHSQWQLHKTLLFGVEERKRRGKGKEERRRVKYTWENRTSIMKIIKPGFFHDRQSTEGMHNTRKSTEADINSPLKATLNSLLTFRLGLLWKAHFLWTQWWPSAQREV